MKQIILDSNFLMVPHQFNIDIFEEIDRIVNEKYELKTLDGVIEELKEIKKSKGKNSIAAKIGLDLINLKNVTIIETNKKSVDSTIIRIADNDTIVATNDKELRQKLKNKNVKVIYLRNKKYLEIE